MVSLNLERDKWFLVSRAPGFIYGEAQIYLSLTESLSISGVTQLIIVAISFNLIKPKT